MTAEEKARMYESGVSLGKAKSRLYGLIEGNGGKPLTIKSKDGEAAELNKKSIDKMLSAVYKSIQNGFTAEQHFAAVSNIDSLFENSAKVLTHLDNKNRRSITAIYRFIAPLFEDNAAFITVREIAESGKKIRSVELIELGKLDGKLNEVKSSFSSDPKTNLPASNIQNFKANKMEGKTMDRTERRELNAMRKIASFAEKIEDIGETRTIPSPDDIWHGEITLEHTEHDDTEGQIYLSHPKLNRGERYFAYANISVKGNAVHVNLEIELEKGYKTINGSPAQVLKMLKAWLKSLGFGPSRRMESHEVSAMGGTEAKTASKPIKANLILSRVRGDGKSERFESKETKTFSIEKNRDYYYLTCNNSKVKHKLALYSMVRHSEHLWETRFHFVGKGFISCSLYTKEVFLNLKKNDYVFDKSIGA
jgi:hypothetical protein